MSITQFLDELGLGQYAAAFEKEAVDVDILQDLSDEDLKTLDVPLGHRKRLLRAIASHKIRQPSEDAVPEHRRVSVLFCDLVGSTQLSQGCSPEEFRDLLGAFQLASVEAVEARGGHVAKYLGDGLMAYFGYPRAFEDDAVRAAEAALDMLKAIRGIKAVDGTPLRARVGIHTGLVVAGEMGAGLTREKLSVVGEAPIIASRLEQLADPDEILVSEAVQYLVEGFVSSTKLGRRSLKGVDEPINVFRVDGRTKARSRLEATRGRGLAEIVGRDEEIALLRSRWDRVCQGDGQIFLVSGEPGIGKSRIATYLHDQISGDSGTCIVVQCSEQHSGSALYPFVDALDRAAGVAINDAPKSRRVKLLSYFRENSISDAAERYLRYLSVSADAMPNSNAAALRQGAMATLLAWVSNRTLQGPGCVIIEDVHWSDPSSLDLLKQLAAFSRETPLLLVVTTRPGFHADWTSQQNATMLSLNRLGRLPSHRIVEAQLVDLPDVPQKVSAIVERAEGVPLFLEELSRVARQMEEKQKKDTIPATLQGSLAARLDGLGAAKHVAQVGSVLGRRFSGSALSTALQVDLTDCQEQLATLVEADILAKQGTPENVEYSFTHALIQDAAYASLLKRDRLRLHGEAADRLLDLSDSRNFPNEVIARHLVRAGRLDEAAHRWFLAGRDAQKRSDDREAIAHFREGLRALVTLPKSYVRDTRELEFVSALAPLLLVVKGWSAPETTEMYARARALSTILNDRKSLLPILYGEYLIEVSQAKYTTALEHAGALLSLAEELDDDSGRVQGNRVISWCSLYLGRLNEAELHASKLLDLYHVDRHGGIKLAYGYDPRIAGLSIGAIISALKGDQETTTQLGLEAVAHARLIDHSSSLAYALMFACAIPAAMRADRATASSFARELKSLAQQQESVLWSAYADVIGGWAGDGGPDVIVTANERLSNSARNPWRPFFFALCADRYLHDDRPHEARELLDQALQLVEQSGERNWEAEILRLLGQAELRCVGTEIGSARDLFVKAINRASQIGALGLADRAQRDLSEFDRR